MKGPVKVRSESPEENDASTVSVLGYSVYLLIAVTDSTGPILL